MTSTRPSAITLASVAGAIAAAAGIAFALGRRRATPAAAAAAEPWITAEPVSTDASRPGSPEDRGNPGFGFDVDRLKGDADFTPVVEYLTYIQQQRGDDEHLLFVRFEDLDAIAALEGDDVPSFLERLDHLGVVVSNN